MPKPNDTERLEWWLTSTKPAGVLNEYLLGIRENWKLSKWRTFIDRNIALCRAEIANQCSFGGGPHRIEKGGTVCVWCGEKIGDEG